MKFKFHAHYSYNRLTLLTVTNQTMTSLNKYKFTSISDIYFGLIYVS